MKALKKKTSLIVLLVLLSGQGCVEDDDFKTPNINLEEPILDHPVISIDNIVALYEQTFISYLDDLGLDSNNPFDQNSIAALRNEFVISLEDTDSYVLGYVISNDEAGNFFEELIIQNKADTGTLGLRIKIDVNPLFGRYAFGQRVYIKVTHLHLGMSNGVLTLGRTNSLDKISAADEEITLTRSPQVFDIIPNQIYFSEFNNTLTNVYVQLNNVQFNRNQVNSDNPLTYAGEATDEFDGERLLESCDELGRSILLSTSVYADFKSLSLPTGQGQLKGILTKNFFGEVFNIVINTPEDVNFGENNNRCDPEFLECTGPYGGDDTIFEEDFENFGSFTSEGWATINISGTDTNWFISDFDMNNYARISAFNSDNDEAKVWLISPEFDMDLSTDEALYFDIQSNYDNGTYLSVWISNDYLGDPTIATWTMLDASIPVGPANTFGSFETIGPINISCVNGTAVIGFFYEGADPNATTRYHIDNIVVTGN